MTEQSLVQFSPASRTELERLSGEIRQLDDQARATAKTAIELAMETGRKLIEARDVIERDDAIEDKEQVFGEWRVDNFSAPTRTLREYMNLARAFDGRDIGHIPQSVLKDLAAPKNEKIREAAFEELSGREELSVKEAREVVDEHRIKAGLAQPKPELTPEELAQKRLSAMVDLFGLEQVKHWLEALD
jgi:hypothetical protein